MKKLAGFTLVELIIFIVVTGILASTMLLTFVTTFSNTPNVLYTAIATQVADACMEGFIGKRQLLGYSALPCSSSPALPSVCSAPVGYTLSANISCSPTLAGDSTNSKTVTVIVSGRGSASLSTLVTDY